MPTIQLRRRMTGNAAGAPAGSPATVGELRFSVPPFNAGVAVYSVTDPNVRHELIIDDGSTNRWLVSPQRQVEIVGDQTVNGIKTFAGTARVALGAAVNLTFGDGGTGEVLTKGAGNTVNWSPVTPFTGVATDDSLIGNGQPGNLLGIADTVWGPGLVWDNGAKIASVDFATPAETTTGTANSIAVTPLGLSAPAGPFGLPVAQLVTQQKTIVPAINEVVGLISSAGGGLTFTGSYDVQANQVTGVGPGADGPLPPANAARDGWFVVCTNARNPPQPPNVPDVPLIAGDWLIVGEVPGTPGSYAWHALKVGVAAILAVNVGVVPPVNGQSNVQASLENLQTTKLATVATEASLTGNGTPGSPLDILVVDGGTF